MSIAQPINPPPHPPPVASHPSRNWFTQPSIPFSQDLGWDRRPGKSVTEGGLFCDNTKQQFHANPADGYTATYPMARFTPGQEVIMQWPAKNHAMVGTQRYVCLSWLRKTSLTLLFRRGVQLFIGKGPGLGDDYSHVTSKDAWIAANPGLEVTFSNCVPNVPGVDGAPCYGTFTLPEDLQAGYYSMIWWWEFNEGEYYSTCFDANILADGVAPPPDNDPDVGDGDDTDECLPVNFATSSCGVPEEPGFDGMVFATPPSQLVGAAGSAFDVQVKVNFNQPL